MNLQSNVNSIINQVSNLKRLGDISKQQEQANKTLNDIKKLQYGQVEQEEYIAASNKENDKQYQELRNEINAVATGEDSRVQDYMADLYGAQKTLERAIPNTRAQVLQSSATNQNKMYENLRRTLAEYERQNEGGLV